MVPALLMYLFLIFIPLSHGQQNSTTPLNNTMTSVPSQYSVPSIASTVDQSTSVLFSSSHPVLRTLVTKGDSPSSAVPSPSPSITWTTALAGSISGTIVSIKSLLVKSSESTKYSSSGIASPSGQLLTGSRTLVPQQKSSIMKTSGLASSILVTTARKPTIIESSSNSVSTGVPRTSKSKITPRSTAASLSSSRLLPNSTSSQNLTSRVILNPSSTPAARNLTSSSSMVVVNRTVSPGEPNSSTTILNSTIFSTKVMLNSTLSSLIVNQTSFSVMRNLSATPTVVNMTSSSSKTSANFTSVSLNLTAIKSSTVKPNKTATSVILNVTSSRVVKSVMPSVVLTSQSSEQRSTVFQNSSTSANEPSCYTYNSLRSCITLQPSSTSGSVFFNVSSMASGGKESTMYKTTLAPGPKDEEKTHTPLIVGLAVGLSFGMLIIIIIIVYYRRKRASYQYNVFYDEQNIVMHPFDYAK